MQPEPSTVRCPLCGGDLHDSVGGCNSCPMHSGCAMLCCDRCGYTTVQPRSATLDFFARLFRRRRQESHAS
ncbi:MAG TPA: hypothetical protein VFE28_12220 [Candidatus Krumholzibacteria bacterium]|nr:hypothetical protein [Candidatus Krumholzibacteria bacterium]